MLDSKKYIIDKLELSHGTNNPLLSMEGLRGVAVFLVFSVHYNALIEPYISSSTLIVSHTISHFSHLGVDLFFVLSGFLIYGSIIKKSKFNPLTYTKRRFERIYPTFLFVFIIYLFLSFLFPSESKIPSSLSDGFVYIIQNLLLLPGLFKITPIITVAWSLSYEVFFYLMIPVVIFSLRLKSWPSNSRIAFWSVITALSFFCFYYWGGPIRMVMFIAGIILFELHAIKGVKLKSFGALYLFMALLIFGLRTFIQIPFIVLIILTFLLFIAFCLVAFNSESSTSRWLVFSPLRWLGNMSYSYYLIHGLVLKFSFLVLSLFSVDSYIENSWYYLLWAPLFIFTLGVSLALYLCIERPLSLNFGTKKE